MKKLTFLVILLTILGINAMAQEISKPRPTTQGVIIGMTLTTIKGDVDGTTKIRNGATAGLFFTYSLLPAFDIQPEILYCQKGTNVNDNGYIKLNYITLPVLLKYKSPARGLVAPTFFAGPELGILLSAKINKGDAETDYGYYLKNFDWGFSFGVGIDVRLLSLKLMLDARYTFGLTNMVHDPGSGDSLKNSAFMLTAGLGF